MADRFFLTRCVSGYTVCRMRRYVGQRVKIGMSFFPLDPNQIMQGVLSRRTSFTEVIVLGWSSCSSKSASHAWGSPSRFSSDNRSWEGKPHLFTGSSGRGIRHETWQTHVHVYFTCTQYLPYCPYVHVSRLNEVGDRERAILCPPDRSSPSKFACSATWRGTEVCSTADKVLPSKETVLQFSYFSLPPALPLSLLAHAHNSTQDYLSQLTVFIQSRFIKTSVGAGEAQSVFFLTICIWIRHRLSAATARPWQG